MSDRLVDIKYWAVVSHQGIHPSVSFSKSDFDWLIEQVEKIKELEEENQRLSTELMMCR